MVFNECDSRDSKKYYVEESRYTSHDFSLRVNTWEISSKMLLRKS